MALEEGAAWVDHFACCLKCQPFHQVGMVSMSLLILQLEDKLNLLIPDLLLQGLLIKRNKKVQQHCNIQDGIMFSNLVWDV